MADILYGVGIKSWSLNTHKALTRREGPSPLGRGALSPPDLERLAFRQAI
jgi:hypothetical protein